MVPLVSACASKEEPHLGESISAAASGDTVVVARDARTILPSGGLAGEEIIAAEIRATVEAIDIPSRMLTLKSTNGETRTFTVPREVRNFAQIKKGDLVKVGYRQELTFELREPTPEEVAASGSELVAAGRARLGEMPAALTSSARLAVVTVDSVSREKEEIGLKTADGRVVKIRAKYPENLSLVKEGQKAVVMYGETILAQVDRVQ